MTVKKSHTIIMSNNIVDVALTSQLLHLSLSGNAQTPNATKEEDAERDKRNAIKRAMDQTRRGGDDEFIAQKKPIEDLMLELKLDDKENARDQPSSTTPKLRDYQTALVEQIQEKFKNQCPSILMHLPTGGGKTAVIAHLVANHCEKIAVFVHRDELAWQMHESLIKWGCLDEDIGFIKSSKALELSKRIQIASIQTFAKKFIRETKVQQDPPQFDLVIIDEAHHAMADEYLAVVAMYPNSNILGVTATPYRLGKGEHLGDVFQHFVKGPSVQELTSKKWLVPAIFMRSTTSRCTLGKKLARHETCLKAAVDNWKKNWSSRRTLAFCMDISHAMDLKQCFEQEGISSAIITGKMKHSERERLLYKSRCNDIQVLCSVDVISEGVDTVWIDCLLLFRPTDSCGLFSQQIGRGLRPYFGKQNCIVLDEVGNVFKHGFPERFVGEEKPNRGDAKSIVPLRIFDCRTPTCKGLVLKQSTKCGYCANH